MVARPQPVTGAAPDDGPSTTARLRAALDAITPLADELGVLLGAERERLVARDWEAVLRLADDKDRLVQQLQARTRELELACAGRSPEAAFTAAGLSDAHAQLREHAARLQHANRESRALLDHHRARVDTALRLMNRHDTAGLYGRDGYAGSSRPGQRLASA